MANPTSLFVFLDQSGANPLPSGITVSITAQGTTSPVIATGTTDVNGSCLLALAPSTLYTATFSGVQAPPPYDFSTGTFTQLVGPFLISSSGGSTINAGLVLNVPADGSAAKAVTFSTPFTSVLNAVVASISNNYQTTPAALTIQTTNETLTGFSVSVGGGAAGSTVNVFYIAEGA